MEKPNEDNDEECKKASGRGIGRSSWDEKNVITCFEVYLLPQFDLFLRRANVRFLLAPSLTYNSIYVYYGVR